MSNSSSTFTGFEGFGNQIEKKGNHLRFYCRIYECFKDIFIRDYSIVFHEVPFLRYFFGKLVT